ncbi:MAG: ribosomal protein S18-alanine N-acetyltransferase [Betaproteobacteria bacterium]|nr:ribosomal protein S18-alanine N-acetyltransferase [Betaproteobacteria bacterium]
MTRPAAAASSAPVRRAMTVADIAAVLAIETQAYSHPWSQGNFIDSLAAGHVAEVLVEGDRLIGYFIAMVGVDELHLLNVTVGPAHQGRGHGSRLLDAVCAHALARSLPTVWLEVRASNQRARALYARRGFAEVGLRRGYYPAARGREDAVVMRRLLDMTTGLPAAEAMAPSPVETRHAVD